MAADGDNLDPEASVGGVKVYAHTERQTSARTSNSMWAALLLRRTDECATPVVRLTRTISTRAAGRCRL